MRSKMPVKGPLLVGVAWIIVLSLALGTAQGQTPQVLHISIDETITSATADYVEEAIAEADKRGYDAILLTINTPGGLADATFAITDGITGSEVPFITFVYPIGGGAWSAGTYILMASDYAAMAPFTLIGSAQPISGLTPVNESKIINAFAGRMGEFAKMHERNGTQARRFVTHNDNLDPEEALRHHVIEAIATTPAELLEKADGVTVRAQYDPKVLRTKGASLRDYAPSPGNLLLRIVSDPMIATLLITIGLLAIVLGLSSPGWGVEVLGIIMLILGLIGSGFNVNYGALLLIAVGVVLILIEVYSSAHGAAAIGGVIVMTLGAILLVGSPPEPGFFVSPEWFTTFLAVVLGVMAVFGAFFGFLAYKVIIVRKKKPVIGKIPKGYGRTTESIKPGEPGYVMIEGEYWSAVSRVPIDAGKKVRVVGKDGPRLIIEPAEEGP